MQTREGYQNALKKTDLMVLNAEAFVEASSSEDMDDAISIPDLIGDPDAPVALVKNPTKTVKVKQLSEDISSQQLKEALAFCQSGISSFYLGSTSSVLYVEFEVKRLSLYCWCLGIVVYLQVLLRVCASSFLCLNTYL